MQTPYTHKYTTQHIHNILTTNTQIHTYAKQLEEKLPEAPPSLLSKGVGVFAAAGATLNKSLES